MKSSVAYLKLSTLCKVQNGYAFDSKLFTTDSNDMPLVRIRDIKTGKTETFYKGEYSQEYVLHNGDFIIGMDGEFNITEWQGGEALLNQRVCRVIVSSNKVLPKYILYFLPIPLKKIEEETPFVTVKHLSSKKLNDVIVPVPSIEEQRRIVDELDLITGILNKKNQQVRDIDSVIMALFYEKCEVFLNDNSYYTPLENVCTLLTDGDWIESKDQSEDGIRLIQTGNVGVGVYKDKAEKSRFISEETFKRLNCTEVLPGDILISRLPDPVGRACVIPSLPKRMITSVDCSIIRLNESILPSVLVQYTKTREYYRHLENYITGATRKRISRKNLSRVPFLIPPMTVQKEVEECYNALVRTQQQINESIQETRRLLESRMDRYFNQ